MKDMKDRRPPREARRLAGRMTRPRFFSHRQAAADTQIQDLARALRMKAGAVPSAPGGVGRKMRLGPEARALVNRVRGSRTLREAQAWMRELAHEIRRRARIHERRRRVKQKIAKRGRQAGRGVRRGAAAAGRGIRDHAPRRARPAGRPAAPAVPAAPRPRAPRPVPAALRTRRRAARLRRAPRMGRPAA